MKLRHYSEKHFNCFKNTRLQLYFGGPFPPPSMLKSNDQIESHPAGFEFVDGAFFAGDEL